MKLAYVIPRFPVLSETFIVNEIERLGACGIDVRIFSFARPSIRDLSKLSQSARRLQDQTIYISWGEALLATLTAPLRVLRGVVASRRIHRVASIRCNSTLQLLRAVAVAERMRDAGITHLHAHWPYASQVAHIVRELSGASYSVSVHAHEVAHDGGHFPLVFSTLAFAAFCNRGAMDYLLPRIPQSARGRAHLIYHGVDLAMFKPLPLTQALCPIRVISAGRLTRTKGFDRLVRACATACRQGVEVHLTVLGHGPLAEELLTLAASLGYSDRFDMPGWVSHEQVRDHMQRAHVFALLADTSYHDGLPNVVLEAMASGRPVVLSPLPSASEVVTSGVEGYVLETPDDFAGFVNAMRALSAQPEIVERMGMAARRRVERDHDANVQIEMMAGLMRSTSTLNWESMYESAQQA